MIYCIGSRCRRVAVALPSRCRRVAVALPSRCRRVAVLNRKVASDVVVNTYVRLSRGGTGLKTVFVSVCGNLQRK
jgi:hypothetical protein